MNIEFSKEDLEFQQEVRSFINKNLSNELKSKIVSRLPIDFMYDFQ